MCYSQLVECLLSYTQSWGCGEDQKCQGHPWHKLEASLATRDLSSGVGGVLCNIKSQWVEVEYVGPGKVREERRLERLLAV